MPNGALRPLPTSVIQLQKCSLLSVQNTLRSVPISVIQLHLAKTVAYDYSSVLFLGTTLLPSRVVTGSAKPPLHHPHYALLHLIAMSHVTAPPPPRLLSPRCHPSLAPLTPFSHLAHLHHHLAHPHHHPICHLLLLGNSSFLPLIFLPFFPRLVFSFLILLLFSSAAVFLLLSACMKARKLFSIKQFQKIFHTQMQM